MAIAREHDIHRRRLGRNLGIGAALLFFVVLVFAVTLVKLGNLPPQAPAPATEIVE